MRVMQDIRADLPWRWVSPRRRTQMTGWSSRSPSRASKIVTKLSWNSETGRQGGRRSTLPHPDSSIFTQGLGIDQVGDHTREDESPGLESEAGAAVGLALPPHPDSSILTHGLRMTWWGAECGMGSSFESLRMSGLEEQVRFYFGGNQLWRWVSIPRRTTNRRLVFPLSFEGLRMSGNRRADVSIAQVKGMNKRREGR